MAPKQLVLLLKFAVIRHFDELLGRHTSHLRLLQIVGTNECDTLKLSLLNVELGARSILGILGSVNDDAILRSGAVEASLLATLVKRVELFGAMGVVGTVHFVEKWTIGLCIFAKETEIFFVAAGVSGGFVPAHCDDRVSCDKAAVCV